MTRTVRIATWNLHEGLPAGIDHGPPQPAMFTEVVSMINTLAIDVVCFQEVDYTPTGESGILSAVKNRTGLSHIVSHTLSPSSFFKGMSTGVAIASRFPLRDVKRKLLPNPKLTVRVKTGEIGSHDKGHVSAKLDLDGREVSIASLHALPFHVFGHEAADPRFGYVWTQLVAGLTSSPNEPTLVCGDFNTPQRELVLAGSKTRFGSAVESRPTFEDLAFDDILYSDHFERRHIEVVPNFSDHDACVADLELPGGTR